MYTYAVYKGGNLIYIGLHSSEADCWQIYLGWPSEDEIRVAKINGAHCERVSVTRYQR